MNTIDNGVAVVAGVGPGLGAAVCRRFCEAGYRVAGLARSSEFGERLAAEISSTGGTLLFQSCDLTDPGAVDNAMLAVETELGKPVVLVSNAGRLLMSASADTHPDQFEEIWKANCLGAFLCARRLIPGMLDAGGGAMVFTGATAGVKAGAGFAAFASAKFALRGMAQSLARELGPRGIHVAHVIIDGIIDTERSRRLRNMAPETCLRPQAIAETYLQLVRQDRSAWTHELDLRPDVESF